MGPPDQLIADSMWFAELVAPQPGYPVEKTIAGGELRRERRNERVTFCFRETVTYGFEPKSVRQVVNSADQFRLNLLYQHRHCISRTRSVERARS